MIDLKEMSENELQNLRLTLQEKRRVNKVELHAVTLEINDRMVTEKTLKKIKKLDPEVIDKIQKGVVIRHKNILTITPQGVKDNTGKVVTNG